MSVKDIDAFIQHFLQKCVQIIVQSRLGNERTQTKCNPKGKDWFNLDIRDFKDIVDQMTKCLKTVTSSESTGQNLFFVSQDWKICCEILLQNSDGTTLVLEYWIFSNSVLNAKQELSEAKLSQHVYQILNRMSSMLKSLIVLTRSTPAYKLSSKGQSADSYVICYRVYQCQDSFLANIVDTTTSPSSKFSSLKTLGTIKSYYNELTVSLLYRTSMNMDSDSNILPATKIGDELCDKNELLLSLKDDHFKAEEEESESTFDVMDILKPLNPAFASKGKRFLII